MTGIDLTKIKVRIADGAALATIKPETVVAYLEDHGWLVIAGQHFLVPAALYGRPEARRWQLLLPLSADTTIIADYVQRMSELIAALAAFEQRSELAVFVDLGGRPA